MQKNKEINIIADTSEACSMLVNQFKSLGGKITKKKLDIGDFQVSDRIVVERKTVSDFICSITDGRMLKQANEMKDNFEQPLILIEGEDNIYENHGVHENAIRQ